MIKAGEKMITKKSQLSLKSIVFIFPLLLVGCGSIFSAAGPTRQVIENSSPTPSYRLINLSVETIAGYRRHLSESPSSSVALPSVPDIRLVPGDVLRIMVADSAEEGALFAPLNMGGTVFDNTRVDSSGTISLPYLGRQNVAGRTLSEVEALVRRKLKGITSDVQVRVSLTGDLSGSVLVAGAVKAPGRFSALEGPLTLLDAINRAGGPSLEPHLINVVVRTGEKKYEFNLQDLLSGKNQILPPGAEIVLERARKRFVAMGAVGEPGLHDLPSNNPSLLEVLGVVKGLNDAKADAAGVFVFRVIDQVNPESGQEEPLAEVFRLNMKEPQAIFLARQFLVLPEDAVYVTTAAVYEWQKIIAPIVQVLVLGRTLSNGI